ncbi:MAG: zinc ribbon domain-containing protein [Pyrinomonadaceae bacterium]
MPIYEYTCRKCGEHVEVLQKISDKPLARHAQCGGKLEKEWSQTSFQLKGSGWYVTDYAGRKTETADGKEAKSETQETKTDVSVGEKSEAKEKSDGKKPDGKKASKASAPAATSTAKGGD